MTRRRIPSNPAMSSSRTSRRRLKRPHCFICESCSSSSAASTRQWQWQRQRRSMTIHEPTATTVPSSTMASAGLSSTSSSSPSLPSHSASSIQQQQQHSAMILAPTHSPPSSSTMLLHRASAATPTDLPPVSLPSRPPSLAPSIATPVDVPSEPSFRDPALADRYWKYDQENIPLSHAVAAEQAFAAAPAFVKRVLGRYAEPPWFWSQNETLGWPSFLTREDMEEEKGVCVICREEYRESQPCYILLRCFHFFHKHCLLEWGANCLVQGNEISCPLCRSNILYSPV